LNLMHQPLDARAYCPDWGQEFFDGLVVIGAASLRFTSAQGSLEIPLERLRAEVRPHDEERLVFTDVAVPGLEVFTTELALLDCPIPPLQQARTELSDRWSRRELRRRMRVLGWCVIVMVVLTILGSFSMSSMVRAIAARVSPERDAAYGAAELGKLGMEFPFVTNASALARIVELTEPLLRLVPAPAGTNRYQFHLVAHDDPNAFALPGGHIVITTSMLELTDAEAHEVAHVTERHIYRQEISSAGPLTICALFMGRSQFGTLMGGGAALFIGAGFSQEYETEADEVGWDYLMAANIDPRGMIRFFRKVQSLEEKAGGDGSPQAFHSHPATAKRIQLLEARWAKQRRQSGFIELPPWPKFKWPKPGDGA
jgi:Zn-dependent protease with chaperone function